MQTLSQLESGTSGCMYVSHWFDLYSALTQSINGRSLEGMLPARGEDHCEVQKLSGNWNESISIEHTHTTADDILCQTTVDISIFNCVISSSEFN